MHTSSPTIELYMAEVRTYPLLDRDQESQLAARVARGQEAERALQQGHLEEAETIAALRKAVAGGERARQRLIECNLRLVIHLANRYRDRGLPLEDLIQEGNIGLSRAVERYDPGQGTRLVTYAWVWIERAIQRAIASQAQPIRLPAAADKERSRMRHAANRLHLDLARAPTLAELAAELELPLPYLRVVERWDRAALPVLSLEAPVDAGTGQSLGEALPDPASPELEDVLADLQLQDRVRQIMDVHLEPGERAYLRTRFGLDGGPDRTLQQAADELGLDRARAQGLEIRALRKLRRAGRLYRSWLELD